MNRTSGIVKNIGSLGIAAVLLCASSPAYADQFDDQINALKTQVAQNQAAAASASQQADDYRGRVNQLRGQINTLQSQIWLNQAESNQLSLKIDQAERDMATQKSVLAENIKSMYINGQVTPLEMLASSNNLSDFFNQQQYQEAVKNKIEASVATITALKAKLAGDKEKLDGQVADQRIQSADLARQQEEVNNLLALAESNAAAADAKVQDQNAQITKLHAEQAAAIAAASRHISGGSGCGGYPSDWCNAPQDSLVDSWGMYNRECVSYAAWYVANSGRRMPYWGGNGNANQWPSNARAAGILVDGRPRVGDVAIYTGGYYGHAMVVQQIKGDTVIVGSFNADNSGHYSVDEWNTSALQFIHF